VLAVPVRVVPDHEPGVVAESTGPKIELTAVVGAFAPIVTVVAPAGIVRPRLRAATEKREKRRDFDIDKLDLVVQFATLRFFYFDLNEEGSSC
jgi:hypothetical protein